MTSKDRALFRIARLKESISHLKDSDPRKAKLKKELEILLRRGLK